MPRAWSPLPFIPQQSQTHNMPRKQLSANLVPEWLLQVDSSTQFNPAHVLQGSVYYPGCNIDGGPLQAYGGFAYSFVYVDYHCAKEAILQAIPRIAGYEPLFTKDISLQELSPNPGVKVVLHKSDFYPYPVDQPLAEMMQRTHQHADPLETPFCLWTVLQRKARTHPSHGPERMSMLSIFGEGIATYAAIYNSNKLCPIAIVLCRAEIGFDRNWTLFEQRNGAFERVVMNNRGGTPQYLFTWDRYDPQRLHSFNRDRAYALYWEKYTQQITSRRYLSIWAHQDRVPQHS
jgi:hypothetical protein